MNKLGVVAALWVMSACIEDDDEPELPLDASSMQPIDASLPVIDSAVPMVTTPDAQIPYTPALVDSGVPTAVVEPLETAALDVLFVIDNSGSMANEQQKLAREIPRMVQVLVSGDRYAGREDQVPKGLSEQARRFAPVRSLHLGVVSTNFGGLDNPNTTQQAIQSCAGAGDEGRLQNSLEIAIEGVFAHQGEFAGYAKNAAVIAPDPTCDLDAQPAYQSFVIGRDPGDVAHAFSCVARLGVRGCPFEQPLESMWNALAPSTAEGELYEFANDVKGQGDRYNNGFMREDAALAIVILSDEDDCSVTSLGRGLFGLGQEAEDKYGALNLRCGQRSDDASFVRTVKRYRDALTSLKPQHPERVVLTSIVGVPESAVGKPIDEVLALPEMQFREEPGNPGFPAIACKSREADEFHNDAFPGRRFLGLQKLISEQSLFESICADTYAPVIDRMVNKIAPLIPN